MYKLEKENIYFDNKNIFKCLPHIGFGGSGDVYKARIGNDVYALKIFNGLRKEYEENYRRKLSIDINSYTTPKKIIYINNKFSGYAMDFHKGDEIACRKLNISIDEFAKSSTELIDDTVRLSCFNFKIFDVVASTTNLNETLIFNVMYDNGFKMIDMDDYKYLPELTVRKLEKFNLKVINKMLINCFINSTNLMKNNILDSKISELMNRCIENDIEFEELFNKIIIEAYNNTDSEIEKLSDVGKILIKK